MLDEVGVYRDRDRYLARSLQVTSRMEALVGEILTISRMESGTGLRKEELDLSRLVEEQLEQDRELLDQREMDLSLSLAPGLVLRGDPSLLGRAVDNLLSNAALYSPPGPHPGAHPAPGTGGPPWWWRTTRCPDWGGGPPPPV